MLYIIIAILAFGLLIAVHEFGHFITAKLLGVRVNEFAIGMGPSIWKHRKGETLYALRLFPIGGFCAMEGEDDDSNDPRAFGNKAWWKKLIILSAGSAMNFLAGLLILLILFSGASSFNVEVAGGFEPWSTLPAQGLQVGDRFLSIDGHRMLTYGDAQLYLSRVDGRVDIVVEREGQRVTLRDLDMTRTPVETADGTAYRLGVSVGTMPVPATIGTRLRVAFQNSIGFVRTVWVSLGDLVTGRVGVKDLSGPIGIVGMISDVGNNPQIKTADKLGGIANFVAFIAVNLAVMNLLPIPALDGGRIFFLAVNGVYTAISRRKLDPKYEGYINMAGLFCLMLLMVVVAVNDVLRRIG